MGSDATHGEKRSLSPGIRTRVNGGRCVFIYDTKACTRDEDDPVDAVCFFTRLFKHHAGLTHQRLCQCERACDSQDARAVSDDWQCQGDVHLVSQLMGVTRFLQHVHSFPSVIRLRQCQFCLQQDDRFIWAMNARTSDHCVSVHRLLTQCRQVFVAVQAELPVLLSKCDNHAAFRQSLRRRLPPVLCHVLASSRPSLCRLLAMTPTSPLWRRMNCSLRTRVDAVFEQLLDIEGVLHCQLAVNNRVVRARGSSLLLHQLHVIGAMSQSELHVHQFSSRLKNGSYVVHVGLLASAIQLLEDAAVSRSGKQCCESGGDRETCCTMSESCTNGSSLLSSSESARAPATAAHIVAEVRRLALAALHAPSSSSSPSSSGTGRRPRRVSRHSGTVSQHSATCDELTDWLVPLNMKQRDGTSQLRDTLLYVYNNSAGVSVCCVISDRRPLNLHVLLVLDDVVQRAIAQLSAELQLQLATVLQTSHKTDTAHNCVLLHSHTLSCSPPLCHDPDMLVSDYYSQYDSETVRSHAGNVLLRARISPSLVQMAHYQLTDANISCIMARSSRVFVARNDKQGQIYAITAK